MTDITSLLNLQARARRNARDQLAIVRQVRRDRTAAAQALAEQARDETPARASAASG